MASITQAPNEWNLAYVPNVYVVDNIATADRFILGVYIDGVLVSLFKQPPNPDGVGIFDISRVLQSYMQPNFFEYTQRATPTTGNALSYQVRYGTETAGSNNWNGYYPFRYVQNGYDNWRVLNWDYNPFIPTAFGIFCACEEPPCNTNAEFLPHRYLTNWPTYSESNEISLEYPTWKVRSDEWRTLSFHMRPENWADGTMWGPNEGAFFVGIKYYNAAGTMYDSRIYTLDQSNGMAVRTDCQDMTVAYPTDGHLVATIGTGPENLQAASLWPTTEPASYEVIVYSYNNCINSGTPITDCSDQSELWDYAQYRIYHGIFQLADPCTKFDPIPLSFMNQYGVKDYFMFDRRNEVLVNSTRNNYYRTLGTWSSDTFTIDPHGRGATTFSEQILTELTVSSDWMSDDESKWLEELYTAPTVSAYIDGDWEPCVVKTVNYEQKTIARQKMFRHTITLTYANNKTRQRG